LSKLKRASKEELTKDFESGEIREIIDGINRKPISSETIRRLIKESDWRCCVCWDISKEEPVIVHHINRNPRDNRYENLVVLCLNHHALAHSSWEISRHPLTQSLLKQRKDQMTKALIDYRKGIRPPPGKEPTILNDAFNRSDMEALKHFRSFLDRPAMHQPFSIEGNMHDFLTAITDIIRALNTGILKTREGDEISRTKPRSMFSNPKWRRKLDVITSRFEQLRTRFEIAVRDQEMILRPDDGFYAFHNRELPCEIDAMRRSIILLFNELLREAGLPPLRNIRTPMFLE
jgi:hypothetical protein